MLIIIFIVIYTVVLAMIRVSIFNDGDIDLKIARDFLIPVVFIILGKSVNDIRFIDIVVYIATSIILLFAIFEYCFVDDYLKIFGITLTITSRAGPWTPRSIAPMGRRAHAERHQA